MSLIIPLKKLSEAATIPQQMSLSDAWFDLCAVQAHTLQPGERKTFMTNISMAIPQGYYWRVAPRSWLAAKHGIDVLAWVVDSSYRGDIGVVLLNTGNEPVDITPGMRIAQMIIESCAQASFTIVDDLDETPRGAGAWGSTGV